MDDNSNKKVIQAVFSFLEAFHGKEDKKAVSALILEMIDSMMPPLNEAGPGSDDETHTQWTRLDHGLRSPMNGILGFTNILLEECNDPEAKWKLEQIRDSAQKMMQILLDNRIYGYSNQGSADQAQTVPQSAQRESLPLKLQELPSKKTRLPKRKLPRILIVEDNTVNSNLLMLHLKKRCHLFFSVSGKAAIEVTRNEKIDAVFMDINLGEGMDGTQAMHEIRKQTGNENLPVVAVTGFAGREDREMFLNAGFNDFIPKPFQRQEVIDVLEKIFPKED
ncbi:MAG: response regulator [Bacteroidota bacterium]|jgi:CheY-like chemotaxis protein